MFLEVTGKHDPLNQRKKRGCKRGVVKALIYIRAFYTHPPSPPNLSFLKAKQPPCKKTPPLKIAPYRKE
jgi:hypothetical protein